MSRREEGFYWVRWREGSEWQAADWSNQAKSWFLAGIPDDPLQDDDLHEIDDRRITRKPVEVLGEDVSEVHKMMAEVADALDVDFDRTTWPQMLFEIHTLRAELLKEER